ncbi:MAG: dockerin [Deltaproteobacteria bacterium]|nr:dockerin [Deltaproteobacteria bacterium]
MSVKLLAFPRPHPAMAEPSSPSPRPIRETPLAFGWDWVGVIGTGQSLAVGATPITSTTQPYGNLMLSLGGAVVPGRKPDPWNANLTGLAVAPLVEPLRPLHVDYPAPYPGNLYGETLHSAMARQLTEMARAHVPGGDYVTVHSVVGECGQGIAQLKKHGGPTTGRTGRAYAASLFEVSAIARLARAAGRSYGVGLVVLTHGETDWDNPLYREDLIRLHADYNADLAAVTGQERAIPIYLSQQCSLPNGSGSVGLASRATQAQWRLGVERPGDFVCTGPKYQYPAGEKHDGVHLSALGYQMLGEKVAQVFFARALLGGDWRPLQPVAVVREARTVIVRFHVPVAPLRWDESFAPPAIAAWRKGRGFELRTPTSSVPIESVAIDGESVRVAAATALPPGLTVGYALCSQGAQLGSHAMAVRWGQLRDSDPFTGSTSVQPNPNHCVSFEVSVP